MAFASLAVVGIPLGCRSLTDVLRRWNGDCEMRGADGGAFLAMRLDKVLRLSCCVNTKAQCGRILAGYKAGSSPKTSDWTYDPLVTCKLPRDMMFSRSD